MNLYIELLQKEILKDNKEIMQNLRLFFDPESNIYQKAFGDLQLNIQIVFPFKINFLIAIFTSNK